MVAFGAGLATLLLQVSVPHFGTERPVVVEALVRLARPYARYRAAFGPDLEPSVDSDDVLLAVNTTRWWQHDPRTRRTGCMVTLQPCAPGARQAWT
jgi:hypothetical protein